MFLHHSMHHEGRPGITNNNNTGNGNGGGAGHHDNNGERANKKPRLEPGDGNGNAEDGNAGGAANQGGEAVLHAADDEAPNNKNDGETTGKVMVYY